MPGYGVIMKTVINMIQSVNYQALLGGKAILAGMVLWAGLLHETSSLAADPQSAAGTTRQRVGVYDTRSVALAFFRSEKNLASIKKFQQDGQSAMKAGDTNKVAEMKKLGREGQDRIHRQVFGDAPIDNIMEQLKEYLPEIQKQAKVKKIVPKGQAEASAEIVDVTSLLVEKCQPTAETLKMIQEMKQHPPLRSDQFPIHD